MYKSYMLTSNYNSEKIFQGTYIEVPALFDGPEWKLLLYLRKTGNFEGFRKHFKKCSENNKIGIDFLRLHRMKVRSMLFKKIFF